MSRSYWPSTPTASPDDDAGNGERERSPRRVVGEEAYVAAGGRIERDLFSTRTAPAGWTSPAGKAAPEKMEALAARRRLSSGSRLRASDPGDSGPATMSTRDLSGCSSHAATHRTGEREVEALEAETEELVAQLETSRPRSALAEAARPVSGRLAPALSHHREGAAQCP
jgi:hypothetical protein